MEGGMDGGREGGSEGGMEGGREGGGTLRYYTKVYNFECFFPINYTFK